MDVIMPQLGETVLEGSVSTWYKKAGDTVQADEPLFEVETEKVTTEVPAPASGVLSEILVESGVSVKVGTRLAVIECGAAGAQTNMPVSAAHQGGELSAPASVARRVAAPLARRSGRLKLSPVVRRLLREHDLDPREVSGTGRDGRITPKDVHAHRSRSARNDGGGAPARHTERLSPDKAAPALDQARVPSGGADHYTVPLNKIRRVTAAHMVRSKSTSPHTLQAVEVDFHRVDRARRESGAQWQERHGYSLSYLPFVARAVCEAIGRFPYVNASFGADELIVHRRVHLGIAVDLNFEGLAVAVIRDASALNLRGLAAQIHRLAEGARRGKLQPDELSGGTYTISNSGSFGTYFSAPIINQPQSAILSTDGVRKKPVVIESAGGDAIAIRPIGVLAQSFDHRAFDGAYSAAFLRYLKQLIEERDWSAELA